jgi:hypothetical protein
MTPYLASAQTTDVALGIEALARRDVNAAEAAFRRGTTAENALLHAAAWQWLGHVAWKFRGDTADAKRYLDRALAEARDSSQILLEVARVSAARGRYAESVSLAHEAMVRSGDAERRGGAARAAADLALDAQLAAPSYPFKGFEKQLREIRDTLGARVARFPGRTTDAQAFIRIAVALDDTTGVRDALRSYFRFGDPSSRRFDAVETTSVWNLVVVAGFFEEWAAHANLVKSANDDATYGRFLHHLRAGIDGLYAQELAGKSRPGDARRLLNTELHSLWRASTWKQHTFVPGEVSREIAKRYGAVITIERGRGGDEVYFAHRLGMSMVDGAPIVVLDGTVASGIDEWLLDGTGGRAGWVANDTVYERRTGFTETPFRALMALTDPQTIPGELFRVTRDSIGDIERARRDSLGYFPGVAARIFRSGAQTLLDSLKTAGRFTQAMFEDLTRTSIVMHETRHRADLRSGRASTPADDEFRAKLDEVTGAPLPKLALTAILSPNIGDGSPHGQANRRIMIGLNRWIRRNGASIAGYDAGVPALLQLPSLTNAQLRSAFNSMRAP